MRRHESGIGCGARGRGSQPRTREASGHRPSPLWGTARKGWTGQDERSESSAIGLAKSQPSESRKHGPRVQSRRDGALSGARPAIRAPAPQGVDYTGAAWRSIPSLCEG